MNPYASFLKILPGVIARVVVICVFVPAPVLAQPLQLPAEISLKEVPAEDLIEAARAALARGEVDNAALLLEGVKPGEGDVDDLDFLHGSIAAQRGDWQEAIRRFRAMLARNPNLPRVRLDLALAYFQAGEDGNSAYHFRLALGTKDLPEVVRNRALAFLERIRRRRGWSLTGSLAIVPDSNINNATDAREVELFGLPATLSEDGRRTSGVGLTASLYGGYEKRIRPDLRYRVSGGINTRNYPGESDYNERIISLATGPRLLFERVELRPEVTAQQRWLKRKIYSRSHGLGVSGNWLIDPTWRLGASLDREWVEYKSSLGDGNIDSVGINLAHALGRATQVQGDVLWRREKIDSKADSWREYIVGLSVSRELPRGFVVSGGPTWRWRKYEERLNIHRRARDNRTRAIRATLSNRNIEWFGFMPEFTLRRERRSSNLNRYDYARTAAEIGFVRSF